MRQGARGAIACLGIKGTDRVTIVTDTERRHIATLVAEEARARGATATMVLLEDYGERPITAFPDRLRAALEQAAPTATYYIATARPGEVAMRMVLRPFLTETLKVRHGHMIGITDELMCDGMCANYDAVYELTMKVYEIVRAARQIHVTSARGTDLTATFDPALKWVPSHGRYHEQGTWGNLPEGETFTSPAGVEGRLVVDLLGDFFSEKYGLLDDPVTFTLAGGQITAIDCRRADLRDVLQRHFYGAENGRRAGEFAIGTLAGLDHLTGNLLQDEKLPGVHVAFGNPYQHETGATWASPIHVDVIPTRCTIEVDGRAIMRDGTFLI
jgi:leucyl aminopeptidase (aminopeptidase T)